MKVKQGRILLNLRKENVAFYSNLSSKKKFHILKEKSLSCYMPIKNDPRPISDKNYIALCIRELISFLKKNKYNKIITPKKLVNPTSKDFYQLLFFLFKKIDIRKSLEKKIEENFQTMFKELKCPFLIPKSSRYAIGSPHIWPILLSSLKWIIELLQFDLSMQKRKKEISITSFDTEQTIWKQMGDSFNNFSIGSLKSKKIDGTLKALVKYIINGEKITRQKKIKKLKIKFLNFQILRGASIFLNITDNHQILRENTIRFFFEYQTFDFEESLEKKKRKNQKLVFKIIIIGNKTRSKIKSIKKIESRRNFFFRNSSYKSIKMFLEKRKNFQKTINSCLITIKKLIFLDKFYLFISFSYFKKKRDTKSIYLKGEIFTYSINVFDFFFFIKFLLLKIPQNPNRCFQEIKKKSIISFNLLKIRSWKFQQKEDHLDQKLKKTKKFLSRMTDFCQHKYKKNQIYSTKKTQNSDRNFIDKVEFEKEEVFALYSFKINAVRFIFNNGKFENFLILKNFKNFMVNIFANLTKIMS